jgi:hypothetical protein
MTMGPATQRDRGVLAAAEDEENKDVASEFYKSRRAVARWRDRFATPGPSGIRSKPSETVR